MHCRFDPNQGRTTLCCLYIPVFCSLLCCVTRSTHIRIGELANCLNSVLVVVKRMHRSLPLVPLDSCPTTAACSFAVSQTSELALRTSWVPMYHQQQNKSYPKGVYMLISKLYPILAITFGYVIMSKQIRYG